MPKMAVVSGDTIDMPLLLQRNPYGRGPWEVDACFPRRFQGKIDMASIDEGSADLLYGLVRALRPRVVLETGTHRGRSTRALVEGVYANDQGKVWTVDMDDYQLMTSGAIAPEMEHWVEQIVGKTPAVFEQEPLKSLQGIDFAHIDGDHTREGLEADLQYVREHMGKECWLFVDNARDGGWPDVRAVLDELKEPHVQLATMCGGDLIWFVKHPDNVQMLPAGH